MISQSRRNQIFETIDEISRQALLPQIAVVLAGALQQLGFEAWGINSLPPPGEDSNPVVVTENVPDGFRDLYIHERFYLTDHICTHARAVHQPFRYGEAPYDRANSHGHQRFLQALDTFEMGDGLVVPIGRPAAIPACAWLAGKNPDLDPESRIAAQTVVLFAASKAYAISQPAAATALTVQLTPREREALQWISAGKTSWEISMISGLSERAINKVIGEAMTKLEAVTRAQAVVNAIRIGEIEL
jgi:DNA-binding CsgD family transcriptional regulator